MTLNRSNPDSTGAAVEWLYRLSQQPHDKITGPLSGLTFAVKDNIDVAGVPTTAGCPVFAYMADTHAGVVERILGAGASLEGKTNLDQFACGLNGTRSPYGAVPNAINPDMICGGSSAGSAYVVATGQVDFALGTDTAGSGRVPAGLNNIVGLKPSKGLLSNRGVVPAARSADCVSIFARTVSTAVQVLLVAAGHDPLDPYSKDLHLNTEPFGNRFVFGVPDELEFFGDTLSEEAFKQSIDQLEALGGKKRIISYAPLKQAAALLYESALVAERYEAIRDFFDTTSHAVIEPVRSIIAQGKQYSAADLLEAQTELRRLGQIAAVMWRDIDVLLVPTAPTSYTLREMQDNPVALNRNLGTYTNFVNLLDYAAISVPSSFRSDGQPFGVTFIAPSGSDLQLAELAQCFHHATGLTQGATRQPLPALDRILKSSAQSSVLVAVVGAHLSGMPLNYQLTERNATLVSTTRTAADYQLYALANTSPRKPGMIRVAPGKGSPIEVEVWQMPISDYGSFVAMIPGPLGIGTITLEDGRSVQGFVCEPFALEGALDISSYGGWRPYVSSGAGGGE